MEARIKKKLRFIWIIFLIIIIPIGYYVLLTISIDTQNRDLLNVIQANYRVKPLIRTAIESSNRAIFWKPWDETLRKNRMVLLIQIQDYYQALNAIEDDISVLPTGDNYAGKGLVYEYLGNMNKAEDSYREAIEIFKDELIENPQSDYLLTEIATLSIIVGDTTEVRDLLNRRKVSVSTVNQEMMNRQNELILNYKSGGLLWFIEKAKRN